MGSLGTATVSNAAGAPLTICVDYEETGATAAIAKPMPYGAQADIARLNASGGLLGHKLKLVELNNQTQPSLAAQTVRECVQKYQAWAVIGLLSSSDLVPSIPVANELHVPVVAWSSGWNFAGLPASAYTGWAFPGLGNAYVDNSLNAVLDLAVPRHYTRVALMYENDPAAVPDYPAMQGFAKKYHFKLVSHQTMQYGQTNVTPAVLQLLSSKPQLIVTAIAPGTDSVTFLKALRSQDQTVAVGVCAACATPSFIQSMGGPAAMKNTYSNGTDQQLAASLPKTKKNEPIISDINTYYKWMKKEGFTSIDQMDSGTSGWVSVQQLVGAVNATKSVAPASVKSGLQNLHINTLNEVWSRTPKNYASVDDLGAIVSVNPDGSLKTVQPGS